jgi:AraC-like DNA-binding protein
MKTSRASANSAEPAHSVPGAYALQVADLLARWNVPESELLSELGLTRDALEDPAHRLPLEQFVRLIERARRVTGEPGLGIYLGLSARISAHGYVGFAAMTAKTLREASEIAVRYVPTRTTAIGLTLEIEARTASLVIEEHADLGPARDTILTTLAVSLASIGNTITGRQIVGQAEFAFPEPPYFQRLASLLPASSPIRYDQPRHRLLFEASQLDWPLVESNSAALRLAREQCERELDALSAQRSLGSRVAVRILDRAGGVRPVSTIARELSMSARTLKRRLADEGTSYSALLEDRRRLRAVELLGSELTIEQIAAELGYSDPANFTRAFRRWTGKSPREARQGR